MVVNGVLRVHGSGGVSKFFKVLCQAADIIHLIKLIGNLAHSDKGGRSSGQKLKFGVRCSAACDRGKHSAAYERVGKRVIKRRAGIPGRLELLKARKVAKAFVHDGDDCRLDFIELSNGGTLLARAIRAVIGGGELLLDALRLIGRIVFGPLNRQLVDHFGERSDKTLRRIRGNGLPTVKSKVERLFQVDAGKAKRPTAVTSRKAQKIAGNDGKTREGVRSFRGRMSERSPKEISSSASDVTIPAVKVNSYPSLTSAAVPRAKISLGRMASPLNVTTKCSAMPRMQQTMGTRVMTPPVPLS